MNKGCLRCLDREDDMGEDSESDESGELSVLAVEDAKVQRLLPRDMPMHQSSGSFNIQRRGVRKTLLLSSAFYMVLQIATWKLLLLCLLVYLTAWLLYALWWLQVAKPCGISIDTYKEALYLSIETMMTIGYGVDDPFFNNCWEAMPVLICQSFTGLLIDIAIVGIVFQRISRAHRRASTIIFSDKLLLQVKNERVQFAFRIAEMNCVPLLQVVLQAYCVLHTVDLVGAPALEDAVSEGLEEVVVKAVHLQGLDDNNNTLLCGLPSTVTHTIDQDSPLAPCQLIQQCQQRRAMKDPSLSEVTQQLRKVPFVEIIVILSGTEQNTGSSVEGRQSYTLQDIVAGHEFGRCVSLDSDGKHCVEFNHFNDSFPMKG